MDLRSPSSPPVGHRPANVADEPTIAAFEEVFGQLGYEPCETGELEKGFEKVATYAKEGEVAHAVRQLANGRWTSKLGRNIDIEHTLRGLEGPTYGQVVLFLKRRTAGTDP